MTDTPITSPQDKQITRFLEDAALSAVKAAREQVPIETKDGAQRVIEGGDQLKAAIEAATVKALRELALPFPFPKNANGHSIITVTGLSLTGQEEIARLEALGFRVGDYAKSCLLSTRNDSYDRHHRLVQGKLYRLAIVPGREVKRNRTTKNLGDYAKGFGYGQPLAGFQPRIRETVSDDQMKEMGIDYIASLHTPIKDSDGSPDVLDSDRGGDGRWLHTDWGNPGGEWDDDGAFAFPVPE